MLTLVDLLCHQSTHQPNKLAFTFLQDGETEVSSLTYEKLNQKARAIAVKLKFLCAPGSRALLLYPPGLEFITAFFGCLYAGVVAVPAYPPRRNQNSSRLQAVIVDAQAELVLTTALELTNIKGQLLGNPELARLQWLATDSVNEGVALEWEKPTVSSDTLAFLQYTSGSTGTPKGVMVSHGNLLCNEQMIQTAFKHTEKCIFVGWLPLFHDMGLIGNVLQPLYLGIPCFLMAPAAFIQKPVRWLQAISRYKATTSGGPNFAYDLCASKITPEQQASLDLSSWKVAFNGSEPIRAETLERFASVFAPCGFQKKAFYPCYGMAETTLLVSGGCPSALPVVLPVEEKALNYKQVLITTDKQQDVKKVVGCGRAWLDEKIIIVNPELLTSCPAGQVGEIWVKSTSVAQGYWNRPQETEGIFRAYLADTKEGPFLRTGDLGFLQDEELFVTGRLKDLIIIQGRNHYPQDIELTVERCHPSLRLGAGAAFSVEVGGQERLVIAQEVERGFLRKLNANQVTGAIRQAVSEVHDLQVYAVLLLKTASLPKTSSGKVQRSTCRERFLSESLDVVSFWSASPQNEPKLPNSATEVKSSPQNKQTDKQSNSYSKEVIEAWLISKLSERLEINSSEIDIGQPFAYYGLSSLAATSILGEAQEWLERKLSDTLLYDYPTIETLARYLAKETDVADVQKQYAFCSSKVKTKTETEPIAIVGMGCRFPGAKNPEAFWEILLNGVDAITEVPSSRWEVSAFDDSTPSTPNKMNTYWGGFLEQVEQFEPEFFGIAPREAESIDPQQRLLLEVSWEALCAAGIASEKLAGSQTGVFVGISNNDYSRLQHNNSSTNAVTYFGTGNAFSIAANRLSYLLDLRGPSWAVDTACSSSLVAIHQACVSLQNKECNLALAGGVNLILAPQLSIAFSQAGMLAPDGRCKTFDASANGYVRSEGCGMVILKRLCDAQRDEDNILAVIRGSAVNQDGRSNGLTAPNKFSQQAVICQALENAGVGPEQISYVETHGTGTSLGDPIELNALKEVLMVGRSLEQSCWIGSVKTNIGHLEAAAGVAGLIKTVLSLQHKKIPPHLHLNQLNPYISLEGTTLSIPTEYQVWQQDSGRRFAGVSSFGFGGTNCHIVLEEAPVCAKFVNHNERHQHLLTLSAKSEKALRSMALSYKTYLQSHSEVSLADICFTANTGRSHFNYRLAVVVESTAQLSQKLSAFAENGETTELMREQICNKRHPKIAFLFTGQELQYAGMGHQLYEQAPTFRAAIDQCDEILRPYLKKPLLEVLYLESGESSFLNETAYTQVALFALEYALYQLWKSWGVEPDVIMGDSLGEYVAACVAGVFSLEDALKLVVVRGGHGHLIQSLPGFTHLAQQVSFCPPNKVMISNTTGKVTTTDIATSEYWCERKQQPVSFVDSMETLQQLGCEIFVEIGPKPTLKPTLTPTLLGTRNHDNISKATANFVFLASLQPKRSDWQQLLSSLGELYVRGVPIDWKGFDSDYHRQRVVLPGYPFQRQPYWLSNDDKFFGTSKTSRNPILEMLHRGDIKQLTQQLATTENFSAPEVQLLPKLLSVLLEQYQQHITEDTHDWFYEVKWQQKPRQTPKEGAVEKLNELGNWLILADSKGVGITLAELLRKQGHHCVLVYPKNTICLQGSNIWEIDPESLPEFQLMLQKVVASSDLPLRGIVHLWSLEAPQTEELTLQCLEQSQIFNCASVLHLVKALAEMPNLKSVPKLWFVTRNAIPVDTSKLAIAQAPLWGLGRVLAVEHSEFWGGMLDLPPETSVEEGAMILAEIGDAQGEDHIALRQGQCRYVARLIQSGSPQGQELTLRSDGCYLITGGLGSLGLLVAQWMVKQGARHLVLVGRRQASPEIQDVISQMQQKGVEVQIVQVDVADEGEMKRLFNDIRATMPPLLGIIHAAGVLDDGVLLKQNWERFHGVMAAKVKGAWNLHKLTQELSLNSSLDFFVLFSSVAALLGSLGQGNYAAANSFMDALAHYRHGLGLKALSINWSPWKDSNMITSLKTSLKTNYQVRSTYRGMSLLRSDQGLRVLKQVLGLNYPQVGVVTINWSLFREQFNFCTQLPLFSEIIRTIDVGEELKQLSIQKVKINSEKEPELLEKLRLTDNREQQQLLTTFIQNEVARLLGFSSSQLPDLQLNFFDMGMDSLMAIELKNNLEKNLGKSLSSTLAFNYHNIEVLAQYLCREVLPLETPFVESSVESFRNNSCRKCRKCKNTEKSDGRTKRKS